MFVIGGWVKRVLGTRVCITGTAHREGRCIQLWSCGLGADQRSQQLWPPPALRYSIPSWLGKFPHTVDFLLIVLHFTFNSIHFTYQENKRMTCKNFNDIMNFHFVLKFHENFIIQFVMVFSLHPHSFVYVSKKWSNLFEVEKMTEMQTWGLHKKKMLKDVIDRSLVEDPCYSEEDAMRVVTIALLCTQSDATKRPIMSRIVLMLSRDANIEIPEIIQNSKPPELELTELPDVGVWNEASKLAKSDVSLLSEDPASTNFGMTSNPSCSVSCISAIQPRWSTLSYLGIGRSTTYSKKLLAQMWEAFVFSRLGLRVYA